MSRKRFMPKGRILVTALLFAVTTALLAVAPGGAQESALFQLAPLNPTFLAYLENLPGDPGDGEQHLSSGGHALGYIPPTFDRSHLEAPAREGYFPQSFPARYDLRTTSKVTPVKNQGQCGSCWTFATYASLESYLLPGVAWDFSENNMKNTHGFDWLHNEGGNEMIATAYLARWGGPVSEADDPYNPASGSSPPGPLALQKQVQNVIWLPDRAAGQNPDWLKQAIMEGGAVYTAMHWVEPDGGIAWKSATNSYYYSGSNVPDHAVAIVGWDDSYSKTNFYLTPPGNGAFIVRNSWGSDWGQGGYFYVSYYDTVFARCDSNTLFHNAEVPGCYSNIYQYDPLGLTRAINYERDSIWGANIFQARSNESLTAVSFYAIDNNTNYEIRIHTGVRANEPVSGTRQLFNTGTAAWAGYHTVNLSNPVALTRGEQFSIIVKFSTPGVVALLALESPLSGYSSRASASAGESFFSIDGTSWLDSATYYDPLNLDLRNSNVCIKAFTTFPVQISVSADPPAGGSVIGGGTYNSGSKVTVTASPNTGYSFVNWTEGGATVSTDAAYTFTATADCDMAAHFSLGSSVVYGDVSGDEKIDVSDAILVLRQIVGLITFDPYQVEAANVNGNDKVDVGDAILILRYIVGLITVFPVE